MLRLFSTNKTPKKNIRKHYTNLIFYSVHIKHSYKLVRYLDPHKIYFTQPTISRYFNDGHELNDLVHQLTTNDIRPENIPLIRVIEIKNKYYSLDNRRLAAYKIAGISFIPVNMVSLEDRTIAKRFNERFNPIKGIGKFTVITTMRERKKTIELLEEYRLISGRKR